MHSYWLKDWKQDKKENYGDKTTEYNNKTEQIQTIII